jgi:FKBP-type peptidyl-prolyl cis-trans isomerase
MLLLLASLVVSEATPLAITDDGKVKKIVLREGKGGPKPHNGQMVDIRYIGWLADGTEFDSSYTRGYALSMTIGNGVIPAWSIAIQTMTVGEKAKITCDYEYGYGERGLPPSVPPRAQLTFELELVEIYGH